MNEQIKAGSDIHAGDGGYSIGTKEEYDKFVQVRNKSLAESRIKELAEYAWEYITEQTDGWINESGEVNWEFLHEYDKKFAELIVRECANVCLDPNHWYEDAAGEMYSKVIKEHFGVK